MSRPRVPTSPTTPFVIPAKAGIQSTLVINQAQLSGFQPPLERRGTSPLLPAMGTGLGIPTALQPSLWHLPTPVSPFGGEK